MNSCDVIILSSDDENQFLEVKSSLKQVTEIKRESQDNVARKRRAEGDSLDANKACKRIRPLCVDIEPKMEEESQAKLFFTQNLQLSANKTEEHENHVVFGKFLELCRQNDKSPAMEKILHKVHNCYKNVRPDYITSQEFYDLLTLKMADITEGPRRIYVYIKDVVDEMKVRKLKQRDKTQKTSNGPIVSSDGSNMTLPGTNGQAEQEAEDKARKDEISTLGNAPESRHVGRKIKKLDKALRQLEYRIAKLEEKEVDFDEENDSAFIRLERYKSRYCKVRQKFCELTGETLGYKTRITFSGTKSSELNRCIEKFVNRTGQFPDFHDIFSLVKSVQSDANLKHENLRRIAEEAFLSIGRQMQKLRQYESWSSIAVHLKNQPDPADSDPDLESKLRNNREEYASRITNVIDSFAEKQIADKLVAEEVPDEDANRSEESEPDEGEEEEECEEERDFVELVLRGETDLSSDEDTEIQKHKENGKTGVLGNFNDEDSYKSSRSPSPSILDVNQTGELGPVSPPVLGEDLTKRGLCYVNKPSGKDDRNSDEEEEEEILCISLNDSKSDEDTDEVQKREENCKTGVLEMLNDEDSYKSVCVFPDTVSNQEADTPEQKSSLAAHCESRSLSPSVLDVHRTGDFGPVSPPILGEDLTKRGLCYVNKPFGEEDSKSEKEEPIQCISLNDTKFKGSPSHSNQHNLPVSKSPSPPFSVIESKPPHSKQYKNSVSDSLTASDAVDGISHHLGQQNTLNSVSSTIEDDSHLQSTPSKLCEKSKSEFSSPISIIETDVDSSSPHTKQHDRPKPQVSLPTFTIDDEAGSSSLLMHLTSTSEMHSVAESSNSSSVIVTQSNTKHKSELAVHTALAGEKFSRNKFIVTQMEVKSKTNSIITNNSNTVKGMKSHVQKCVTKVAIPSFDNPKHASVKSVSPDVITLE